MVKYRYCRAWSCHYSYREKQPAYVFDQVTLAGRALDSTGDSGIAVLGPPGQCISQGARVTHVPTLPALWSMM